MAKSKNPSLIQPTALILTTLAVMVRLLPHPANMTPLGATAIFGGKKLGRPWNYLLPLGILFLTDLFLGFHNVMIYVYGSFILTVFLAEHWQGTGYGKLTITAVASSLIFFLVTNFGVWQEGWLYPHTLAGLISSYTMGLPFLRNMVAGDLIYTLGFFALYNWAAKTKPIQIFDKRVLAWLN
ncbi:MAG TPA: DUF6580 family putative transport protein [Candidatus Saccharimonadales bacterium]|nr:DUF6580 family putative transport protein [Candidatus Saccharimonadales bacterium]